MVRGHLRGLPRGLHRLGLRRRGEVRRADVGAVVDLLRVDAHLALVRADCHGLRRDAAGPDLRGENTIGKLNRWVILKSNFEFSGLVFSCIATKFCKKILVGKLSARSTRFAYFCTAQILTFQPKIVTIFSRKKNEFPIFQIFCRILYFKV